jgi:hypothetical protein
MNDNPKNDFDGFLSEIDNGINCREIGLFGEFWIFV